MKMVYHPGETYFWQLERKCNAQCLKKKRSNNKYVVSSTDIPGRPCYDIVRFRFISLLCPFKAGFFTINNHNGCHCKRFVPFPFQAGRPHQGYRLQVQGPVVNVWALQRLNKLLKTEN